MISIGCVIARMNNVPLPQFLANGAPSLASTFWQQSANDILLEIDTSKLGAALTANKTTFNAFELHQATRYLTQNPPPPTPSERIALLYASWYAPNPKVFGMMFDRGFATWDDPNDVSLFTASPREGCAVFLGPILAARNGGLAAQQETFFTTLHELGHMFNLQHSSSLPSSAGFSNLMATSKSTRPYPLPYKFIPRDRAQLHSCSKSHYVWPGGAKFQSTGDWSSSSNLLDWMPTRDPNLKLRVSASKSSFWKFEPIELVIEISALRRLKRSFFIPDKVDPGYDNFRIWLEAPNGERRLYHSPRHYCTNNGRVYVAPERPFRRDISIFGQSGGYTFEQSGIWRVWAEFDGGTDKKLRSNRIEVEVLAARDDAEYESARNRLTYGPAARVLYHRVPQRTAGAKKALVSQLEDSSNTVSKGGIEYAIGRALDLMGQLSGGAEHRRRAIEYLKQARDRADLGIVQREKADAIIEGRPLSRRSVNDSAIADWGGEVFDPEAK